MKTAISIPDDLFAAADALARSTGQSRSQLYSRAVREFVARHSPDRVTEALDEVCSDLPDSEYAFPRSAARRVVQQVEW
jgi:metal-responsive CopG/Arc/MetJ family transcriptional regulator